MVASLLGLILVLVGCGGAGGRVISSHGVRVTVPKGWQALRPASGGPVTDPRTLLVVGPAGVRAKASPWPIAAYRIPAEAAVVVVVGWTSITAAGGVAATPGRAPLKELVAVHRPSFECFAGRGAAADVLLGGNPYQVNVLVGDRASEQRVVKRSRSLDRSIAPDERAVSPEFQVSDPTAIWGRSAR